MFSILFEAFLFYCVVYYTYFPPETNFSHENGIGMLYCCMWTYFEWKLMLYPFNTIHFLYIHYEVDESLTTEFSDLILGNYARKRCT